MSNFLKRFKGSKKSSEKDETPKEIEDQVIPRDKEESIKSELSLSPSTSDSDGSPHHIISQASLFSGMKLTKSSQVLEPVFSPYSTPVPTNRDDDETSKFDVLNEDDSNHMEGSGFLFLNQTTPTPTLNEPDGSSGFSFITQPAPVIPPMEEDTSLSPDLTDTTDQTTGFTFLLKEPHSYENNPESSTTDPHSSTTDPHSSTTDPHSSATDPHSSNTYPHSSTTDPHSGTTNPQTDSHTSIPITDSEHSDSSASITPQPLPQLSPIPPITHKVGRQAPPNKKKKKHKAVRPGQERNDEIYSGLVMEDTSVISDLDGISIGTVDSDTRTDDSIDIVIDKGKETIIPLQNSKGEVKTCNEVITDDGISEATIDTTETTGGTMETTGDTMETTGEVTGDTVEVTGNTKETTGGIMEVTGDTVEVTGSTVEATGSTVEAINNTMVAIDDGSDGTLVQLDEELTNSITMIKPSNNDLVGVFSHMTSQDDPADENDDTVNYSIELSPVEKMATLFEVAESNDKVIRNNIDEATEQFSTAIEKNGDVIKKLTKRRQHIKELKAQEAVALSDENYEHAEELRQKLESINVLNDRDLLVDTQTKVDRWLKQCNSLMTSQIALHIEMKEKLTNLKDEQTKNLTTLEKEFSTGHAKEKIRLQTMRDELERERGHIALDRGHLEKRQLLLQDEVSERAAEFIKCKKEFVEEERETEKEIEILEKKLNELKKKQSDLLAKIQSEEDKIMAVSKDLSSEHLQLEEEQDTVAKKEKELQEKVITLNQLQLSYDASLELHNRNTQSIQLVVITSEDKLAEYCNNQQLLEEVVSVTSNWTFTDISELMRPTESMQSLLDNEKLQEDKVGEATAEVLTLQTNIASCCKKITDQETQLQKLQETKKIAVTARQYRDAAKLSAEEKQLSLEISNGRESVSKMEESLSEKNDILLKLNSELDHIREEREMAEKQADIKCINELVLLLTDIKTKSIKHLFLQSVFDQWSKFVMLIIDDLCIKHGLQLSDYITNTQETINNNDDDDTSIVADIKEGGGVKNGTHPPEERTPGVGMEVPGDSIVAEIRLKIEEIEKQIAVCCADEKFDEAADLNDELDSLKAKLTEQLSSH